MCYPINGMGFFYICNLYHITARFFSQKSVVVFHLPPTQSTYCFYSLNSNSRKSTPSPNTSSSELKTQKSDPASEKTFRPISEQILAELSNQGIDIKEKSKCISDETKAKLRGNVSLKT